MNYMVVSTGITMYYNCGSGLKQNQYATCFCYVESNGFFSYEITSLE